MEPTNLALAILVALGLPAAFWTALRLRRGAGGAGGATRLTGLREREFEALVAEAFRAQGYESVGSSSRGPSAVAGLMLRRDRTTFLVDYRYWRAGKVGIDAMQSLQKAMAARGATAGFMLSGGRFSREAIAFAGGCSIQLIDGRALQTMLSRVKGR